MEIPSLKEIEPFTFLTKNIIDDYFVKAFLRIW